LRKGKSRNTIVNIARGRQHAATRGHISERSYTRGGASNMTCKNKPLSIRNRAALSNEDIRMFGVEMPTQYIVHVDVRVPIGTTTAATQTPLRNRRRSVT
jgi:hypothetical protein